MKIALSAVSFTIFFCVLLTVANIVAFVVILPLLGILTVFSLLSFFLPQFAKYKPLVPDVWLGLILSVFIMGILLYQPFFPSPWGFGNW
jgi:hypothetical protein